MALIYQDGVTTDSVTRKVVGVGDLRGVVDQQQTENQRKNSTQKATLTSPDGLYKTVVGVGSSEASALQNSGWKIGSSGKNLIDIGGALSYGGKTTSQEKVGTKTNLQDVVNNFKRYLGRSPDMTPGSTDYNNVMHMTTLAPVEVEQRLKSSAPTDISKIIAKYGYTAGDFANDPNFFNYWSKKPAAELEAALQNRTDFNKTAKRKETEVETALRKEVDSILQWGLDEGLITQDQVPIARELLGGEDFKNNTAPSKEDLEKMIADAEKLATADIDPYYQRIKGEDIENLRNSFADLRNRTLRYQQQEEKTYKEVLEETKQSLRTRGLTFSGIGKKTLGDEGALQNPENIEGSLPQQRRYNIEDANAAFQETAREIGLSAERRLGSGFLSENLGRLGANDIPDPYNGGIKYDPRQTTPIYLPRKSDQEGYVGIGALDLERKRAIEQEKNARIASQRLYS